MPDPMTEKEKHDRERAARDLADVVIQLAGNGGSVGTGELVITRKADPARVIDQIATAYHPDAAALVRDVLAEIRQRMNAHNALPASDYLAGLRSLVGTAWDGIDPDTYVREMRGDDPS